MPSSGVRIDLGTHRQLKMLAAEMGLSMGDTVALAVRRLGQDQIGADLAADASTQEAAWLDDDFV